MSAPTPQDVRVDLAREQRCGFPEVVYAPGKDPGTILQVFRSQQLANQHSLATRVSPEQATAVLSAFPETNYNPVARTLRLYAQSIKPTLKTAEIAILTAGSSDLPVAEEARETLLWAGHSSLLLQDVGVAGPQRLLGVLPQLEHVKVIIVIAGMEGALPSVVAGWVKVPIIAVPTSVGYGFSFEGLSAFLSMLNSCAANVATVNIDAGFKAAYLAALIAR
jgi:NCAIR mutase (PurE)-related protein